MWLLILSLLIFYYFIFKGKFTKEILESEVIPGPKPVPFLGNGHEFHNIGAEATLKKLIEYRKIYGPIFKFLIGSKMWIFVAEPEHLEVAYPI